MVYDNDDKIFVAAVKLVHRYEVIPDDTSRDNANDRRREERDEDVGGQMTEPVEHLANNLGQILPPVDNYNIIYYGLILAGVGFLLPYNSFIMAVDYFKQRYPNTTIMFDMSTIYIFTAFFAVLVNNLLVEALDLNTRITFGYVISILTLTFVAIGEVWWHTFGMSVSTSYTINLVAVAIVAFGCTIQDVRSLINESLIFKCNQSSFYGYTSMLPSAYTQAVMTGESAAGFGISMNRIFTKALYFDDTANTFAFFLWSVFIVVMCYLGHVSTKKSDFVQYYITLCQDSRMKITLEPTEDCGLVDIMENGDEPKGQFGFLKLQSPDNTASGSSNLTAFSFANPLYEPGAKKNSTVSIPMDEHSAGNEPRFKVEDIVTRIPPNHAAQSRGLRSNGVRLWNGIKRGWWARWEVACLIWEEMLCISFAYFVTLTIYPGVISEIKSCHFGSWLPVILMSLFNGFDLLGKLCSNTLAYWDRRILGLNLRLNVVRVPILIFLVEALPNTKPGHGLEEIAMALACTLGITNGIFGSVPMITAPSKVPDHYRELAGNIMTLSYNFGLATGSIAAYYLNDIVNVARTTTCPKYVNSDYVSDAATSTAASLHLNVTNPVTLLATTIANCCMSTTMPSNLTHVALSGVTGIVTSTATPNVTGSSVATTLIGALMGNFSRAAVTNNEIH